MARCNVYAVERQGFWGVLALLDALFDDKCSLASSLNRWKGEDLGVIRGMKAAVCPPLMLPAALPKVHSLLRKHLPALKVGKVGLPPLVMGALYKKMRSSVQYRERSDRMFTHDFPM